MDAEDCTEIGGASWEKLKLASPIKLNPPPPHLIPPRTTNRNIGTIYQMLSRVIKRSLAHDIRVTSVSLIYIFGGFCTPPPNTGCWGNDENFQYMYSYRVTSHFNGHDKTKQLVMQCSNSQNNCWKIILLGYWENSCKFVKVELEL